MSRPLVACVDFGSTFTKAALVERGTGRLVATADHPTTLATDVLDGWRACRDDLIAADPHVRADEPDSVHRMRVAVRRLRSALRTHQDVVDPAARGPLGLDAVFGPVIPVPRQRRDPAPRERTRRPARSRVHRPKKKRR